MTEIKPVNIIDHKDIENSDYDPQTKLAIYTVKMGLAKAIDACHNGRIFYIGGRPFHVVKAVPGGSAILEQVKYPEENE